MLGVSIMTRMKSCHETVFCITGPLRLEFTSGEGNPQVDSPHKGPVMWSFDVFFVVSPNKLLSKQLSSWDLRCHDADETSL